MLYLGKNIRASHQDQLEPADPLAVYRLIAQDADLRAQTQRVRKVLEMDISQYRKAKTSLPYFTCGIFTPAFRRMENFAGIASFVLDFDHLEENGIEPQAAKLRLATDDRVWLLFTSPSGDGLKAVFRLDKTCHDGSQFSLFSKRFAEAFAQAHGLELVVDKRTSDPSRACFLCHDAEAYFNPDPKAVRIEDFADFEDQELAPAELARLFDEPPPQEAELPSLRKPLDDDIYANIRKVLNPKAIVAKKEKIEVPPELDLALEALAPELRAVNVDLLEASNIHYGKKLRLGYANRWAELNLFFGKRGFTVVRSTKSGSDKELALIAEELLLSLLHKHGLL